MSRKKERIMCTLLCMATIVILGLVYQNVKSDKKYEENLSKFTEEIIELKEEVNELEKNLAKKEMEIESFQLDFSDLDDYLQAKFQPDGRVYNVNAANIAFYPNPDLTGRLSELFEFISDISDPLERKDGVTVYGYLTTKGVVYSDMRVSLYAR